jgi:hypothetical protein
VASAPLGIAWHGLALLGIAWLHRVRSRPASPIPRSKPRHSRLIRSKGHWDRNKGIGIGSVMSEFQRGMHFPSLRNAGKAGIRGAGLTLVGSFVGYTEEAGICNPRFADDSGRDQAGAEDFSSWIAGVHELLSSSHEDRAGGRREELCKPALRHIKGGIPGDHRGPAAMWREHRGVDWNCGEDSNNRGILRRQFCEVCAAKVECR